MLTQWVLWIIVYKKKTNFVVTFIYQNNHVHKEIISCFDDSCFWYVALGGLDSAGICEFIGLHTYVY